jgi:hypothetical protein
LAVSKPYPATQCSINRLRFNESKHHARKFLFPRINRLQAGQNAAVLLIDLGTIDIPSKQPDRRAFAGNDESRPGLGSRVRRRMA